MTLLTRHWNFYKFGGEHADENLGALHLGENQTAFFVQDKLGRRNFKELKHANTLWSWGEYSEKSGKTPTEHGVRKTCVEGVEGSVEGVSRWVSSFVSRVSRPGLGSLVGGWC